MKTMLKLGLSATAFAATLALVGCPLPGNVPGTGGTFTFDPNAVLTGQVTFAGAALGTFPDWTPQVDVKQPGGQRLGVKANIQNNQYFQFVPPAQNLTEGTTYQVIWDYAGATPSAAADFNTIDVYVTDPVKADKAAADPMVKFDVQWNVSPAPALNATVTPTSANPTTFSWSAIPNLSAGYQVTVFSTGGSALWSSATMSATTTSVTWNGNQGSNTNSPSGAAVPAGDYTWNIKFWKSGGTFGGSNFHGETLRFPFKITR